MINEQDIFNFLIDRESKTNLDFNFNEAYRWAIEIASHLVEILCIMHIRKQEKEGGQKRISFSRLRYEIKNNDKFLKKYLSDFTNQNTLEYLQIMLHPDFSFSLDSEKDIHFGFNCALTFQKIFRSLSTYLPSFYSGNDYPIKIMSILNKLLYDLTRVTQELRHKVDEDERKKDQCSQNASTTSFRLEKIKNHEKYLDLDNLVRLYLESPQKSTKIRRDIDNLISKIVITESPTTIRRYRRLIFEEYQK